MTLLPISSPTPAPRETLYSYLARLAATWRTDAPDLAYDMGAPFKRLLEQDEGAFETLADWAKLTPDVMDELLSWTGVRAGNVRMEFRKELYISRALRNPVMRGCPVCLREDASDRDAPKSAAMVMRGDWQMREMTLCVKHKHPLVPLWKATKLQDRFNIGTRLEEIEGAILSGALDQPEREPSEYDIWLDRRLRGDGDDTWLREHSIFAVTTICRLFGHALLRDKVSDDSPSSGSVHAAGFKVIAGGADATRKALDQIAATATGHLDEPKKAFGDLYSGMARDYLNETAFDPFRDILRDCILDHWPISAGERLLGWELPERRLHSLVTAAKETGVGVQVLEYFLIEAGAISAGDRRPPSRKLFDAQAYAALLAEIPTLVGPIAMRTAMGATKRELVTLADEGVLIPRTTIEKVKNPWRISDGIALVAELSTGAILVNKDDKDWEALLLSCRRREVTLSELVQSIRDKRLKVGQRVGVEGFHGIVVLKSEVDLMTVPLKRNPKASLDMLSGTVPAAQFGRSIGLRDGGTFQSLIEAGHVPAQQVMNPLAGRPQYRMTPKDIAAFHQKFVTLTTLSAETGQHRNTLKSVVLSGGISPFSPEGQDFGPVYLRKDVAKVVMKDGHLAK